MNGDRWNVNRSSTIHKNHWFALITTQMIRVYEVLVACLLWIFINASISDIQFGNQCLLHHFSLKDPIIHNWFNRNERLTINKTQLLTLLRWIIELLKANNLTITKTYCLMILIPKSAYLQLQNQVVESSFFATSLNTDHKHQLKMKICKDTNRTYAPNPASGSLVSNCLFTPLAFIF